MQLSNVLQRGTLAARPAANTLPNGSLYAATDNNTVYQVVAGAWQTYVAPSGGGGTGTVTQVNTTSPITGGPITETGTIAHADSGATPGTYGDDTHVAQVTVDGKGHVTAVTNVAISGGGGGGGNLQLIETTIVASAVNSVTFAGLDGNADGNYLLIATIRNTTGAASSYTLRPNGITTALSSRILAIAPGGLFNTGYTRWYAGSAGAGAICTMHHLIRARVTQGGAAVKRSALLSAMSESPAGTPNEERGPALWDNTSNIITSLELRSEVGNAIGADSQLSLYKLTT